jgi:hypothetical protein
LKKLEKIRKLILFLTTFFKKSLFLQSANLIIAIALFPIIAHYLNFLTPNFRITTYNIWAYQKGVILSGGLLGLFLALVLSSRSIFKK